MAVFFQPVTRYVGPVDKVLITTLPSGSAVVPLNLLARGASPGQRVGNQINMVCLDVQGVSDTITTYDSVRIAVVLDRAPNGSLAAITDIFNDAGAFSPPNPNNVERFTILYEAFGSSSVPSTAGAVNFSFSLPLGINTLYRSTNLGTIADLSTNALLFCIGSTQNSSGATAANNMFGFATLYYEG